jgi:hypothetical protein
MTVFRIQIPIESGSDLTRIQLGQWIRIRNQDLDPDPESGSGSGIRIWIRIQEGKMTHKNMKNEEIFCFEVLDVLF